MQKNEYLNHAELEDKHWWHSARRRLIMKLIEKYSTHSQLILDIGCGTGAEAEAVQAYGNVVAMDMEPFAIEMTMKRNVFHGIIAKAPDLPFSDASFDLSVACEVFEHVEDDFFFLDELFRVIKQDGLLIFTVPAHPFAFARQDERVHHFRRYTRKRIHAIVSQAGFQMLHFGSFNILLSMPIITLRYLDKIFDLWESDADVFKDRFSNTLGHTCMHIEEWGSILFRHLFGMSYYGVAKRQKDPAE